jgi:hypothetical protein
LQLLSMFLQQSLTNRLALIPSQGQSLPIGRSSDQ